MALDAIFGASNFGSEIVWRIGWVSGFKTQKRGWIRNHDTIFYYLKSSAKAAKRFNKEYIPYAPDYVRRDGKKPTGQGIPIEDTWNCSSVDILDSIMIKSFSTEKTGSPDQKPVDLYKRIIKASSNKGDLVLDPFAGCATTLIAAQELGRRWVGIDRRQDGQFHIVCRMLGIKVEDAESLMKRPDLAGWLSEQMAKQAAHFSKEIPSRTDTGETAAAPLPPVYPAGSRSVFSHRKMQEILVSQFGARCWGCDFQGTGERAARYLELDHVDPKSAGGSDHLDNRVLLCGPCNKDKRDKLTLIELRRTTLGRKNAKNHPIDLRSARAWCRQRLEQELYAI